MNQAVPAANNPRARGHRSRNDAFGAARADERPEDEVEKAVKRVRMAEEEEGEEEKLCPSISDLAPALAKEIASCKGALSHLIYVQPKDKPDASAAAELHKIIGGSKKSRIGVIGSISYDSPGDRYKEHGKEAVQQIVQTAAEAVITKSKPTHVVMGGSYSGPQGTFADACERHPCLNLNVTHVIPNVDDAVGYLHHILWEQDEVRVRKSNWSLAVVGSSFSRRNCILASLNGNYVICAGGPGTHTELCELRYNGAGVLPLVRTGGLCEGVSFEGKNAHGMAEALRSLPPSGVAEQPWQTMLGEDTASLEDYCDAVDCVFGALKLNDIAEPQNRWAMNSQERGEWERFKQSSPDFDTALS